MTVLDLSQITLRELNQRLQSIPPGSNERNFTVTNPEGAHSIAVGLTQRFASSRRSSYFVRSQGYD